MAGELEERITDDDALAGAPRPPQSAGIAERVSGASTSAATSRGASWNVDDDRHRDERSHNVIADNDPERRERAHQPHFGGRRRQFPRRSPATRRLPAVLPDRSARRADSLVRDDEEVVAADGQRDRGPVRTRIQQHQRCRLTGSFGFQMRSQPFRMGWGANRNCASGPGKGSPDAGAGTTRARRDPSKDYRLRERGVGGA